MELFDSSVLYDLDQRIDESYIYEGYNFTPTEYDKETNISFHLFDNDTKIADVKINKTDGESVDAINSTYDYDDVFASVTIDLEGKEYEYDMENVKKWLLGKLANMGFDKNPVKINDKEYDASQYKTSDDTKDDVDDELEDVKDQVDDVDDDRFSLNDLESDE